MSFDSEYPPLPSFYGCAPGARGGPQGRDLEQGDQRTGDLQGRIRDCTRKRASWVPRSWESNRVAGHRMLDGEAVGAGPLVTGQGGRPGQTRGLRRRADPPAGGRAVGRLGGGADSTHP